MRGLEERRDVGAEEGAGVWACGGVILRRKSGGRGPQGRRAGASDCARADDARTSFAPRVRSGLAHAAGFAGLAVLFRPAFATLFLWQLGFHGAAGLLLFLLTGLAAPAALALGFAAGVELDRSPWKSGRPQAMLGFLAGLLGTISWAAELAACLRFLGYL
jgi:hypothetical protein